MFSNPTAIADHPVTPTPPTLESFDVGQISKQCRRYALQSPPGSSAHRVVNRGNNPARIKAFSSCNGSQIANCGSKIPNWMTFIFLADQAAGLGSSSSSDSHGRGLRIFHGWPDASVSCLIARVFARGNNLNFVASMDIVAL
jgi:hypothetical protein